jgi:hypothetical protein
MEVEAIHQPHGVSVMEHLVPVELNDGELDAVAAGILNGGLVNADVIISNNQVDILNNANLNVQAVVNVLSTARSVLGNLQT